MLLSTLRRIVHYCAFYVYTKSSILEVRLHALFQLRGCRQPRGRAVFFAQWLSHIWLWSLPFRGKAYAETLEVGEPAAV